MCTSHKINDMVFLYFLAAAGSYIPCLWRNGFNGVIDVITPEHALALCVWKRQGSFQPIQILNVVLQHRVTPMVDGVLGTLVRVAVCPVGVKDKHYLFNDEYLLVKGK